MNRTVYIDGNQMDVDEKSQIAYIFTSPIFRDIDKIISNRTTTYKLPKTENNLRYVGLSNSADMYASFPYKRHKIQEYRDGLPFIDGVCILLSIGEEIELSVTWGMSTNLLEIRERNLREMVSNNSILWTDTNDFEIAGADIYHYGFIPIDFGRGLDDLRYIHPCVTAYYILYLIEENYNLKIQYPERFKKIFMERWIPLLEKNADYLTWKNTDCLLQSNGGYKEGTKEYDFVAFNAERNDIGIGFGIHGGMYVNRGTTRATIQDGKVTMVGDFSQCDVVTDIQFSIYHNYTVSTTHYDKQTNTTTATINASVDYEESVYDKNSLFVHLYLVKKGSDDLSIGKTNPNFYDFINNGQFDFKMYLYFLYKEVPYGSLFPIVPNLPDMRVTEFLKTLMQMFGLWMYYDKADKEILRLISIDDMYSLKPNAYNWSDKLLTTNRGRFNYIYTYNTYAKKNLLKYKNDTDVEIDANGYIEVQHEALAKSEKIISDLDFSPTNTIVISDSYNKEIAIAKINLYNEDGELQSVGNRILATSKDVLVKDTNHYLTAIFSKDLYFNGEVGLIRSYYQTFQRVIYTPLVVECYIYLKDAELTKFSEANPVYIDGVYYMPITVTVQDDGVATCNLIKMPVF